MDEEERTGSTEPKDPYKILGVARNATADEIKAAYRKQAMQYHPDKHPGKEAEEKMKEINEANQVLSDPEKRSRYDQLSDAQRAGNGQWARDFENFMGGFPGDGMDPTVVMGQDWRGRQRETPAQPRPDPRAAREAINRHQEKRDHAITAGLEKGQRLAKLMFDPDELAETERIMKYVGRIIIDRFGGETELAEKILKDRRVKNMEEAMVEAGRIMLRISEVEEAKTYRDSNQSVLPVIDLDSNLLVDYYQGLKQGWREVERKNNRGVK
jgi:curved DNA-binding protein CbpA